MATVAHVSFVGGGVFLPDHGPGDRRTLVEYVDRLARSKPQVQILLDTQRWMARNGDRVCCVGCGRTCTVSCREMSNEREPHCLHCALGGYSARQGKAAKAPEARHLTLASAGA